MQRRMMMSLIRQRSLMMKRRVIWTTLTVVAMIVVVVVIIVATVVVAIVVVVICTGIMITLIVRMSRMMLVMRIEMRVTGALISIAISIKRRGRTIYEFILSALETRRGVSRSCSISVRRVQICRRRLRKHKVGRRRPVERSGARAG